MKNKNQFYEVKKFKPQKGILVDTMIDDETGIYQFRRLIYDKGLWWNVDRYTYVNPEPTHWRYINTP